MVYALYFVQARCMPTIIPPLCLSTAKLMKIRSSSFWYSQNKRRTHAGDLVRRAWSSLCLVKARSEYLVPATDTSNVCFKSKTEVIIHSLNSVMILTWRTTESLLLKTSWEPAPLAFARRSESDMLYPFSEAALEKCGAIAVQRRVLPAILVCRELSRKA